MVRLRDMVRSDIEDYVRWFTTQIEWSDWDAPWEDCVCTEEEARRDWTDYYEEVSFLPEDRFRRKFEVEADGVHAGWVSSYTDLGWQTCPEGSLAVGIDLPEEYCRGRGIGAEALRQFMRYCNDHGYTTIYMQTWSGNIRMTALAAKLGFREVLRLHGIREVWGEKYDALTYRLDLSSAEQE